MLTTHAVAADWETTRRTVIDPLNTELHRHLPSFLKSRDLDAVLGLYATATGGGLIFDRGHAVHPEREEGPRRWEGNRGPEPIRTRYERLLALFAIVDKAELGIDRVSWRAADADGYPARVRLLVRGTRADGIRATLEQAATLRVAPRHGRWRITREDVTARTLVTRRTPRFARVTDDSGIASVHTSDGSPAFRLFGGGPDNPVGASSGVAVADTDGDGCEDVFLAGSPDAVLYRNRCDGTFSDVTAASGLPHPYPATATGAVFFDYDNDGWPDLFVAAARGGDRLFHNTGGGHFVDVTASAGIPPGHWASMAAVADYDRDGFLDLYVVRMGDQEATTPRPNYAATNGVPSTLYRNNGDGTFTDISEAAGVRDTQWGWSAEFLDYDNDGRLDLYAVNGFISGPLLDDV